MNIGEKIKALRISKNKSQETLAFDIGVSRQTINKWEKNKTQPNTENLMLLCSIFEVSADYFLDSEIITKDEQIAVSSVTSTKCNKHNVLIIGAVIDGIFLLISAIWTIVFGFAAFSTNNGYDPVGTDRIDCSEFVVMLILSLLLFVVEVLLLLFIRNRQKMTQM